MDIAAISSAKDEELQGLGLTRKGDILALRAFCKQDNEATKDERTEKKRKLLQTLKSKLPRNKISKKKLENVPAPPPVKTPNRKISVGWQHFDDKLNRYVSVRLGRGGGARDISLPVCSTKEEILKEMIAIFFTNGNSVFGNSCAMKFELGNFKCEEIKDDDFTLARYITQHKLSKIRIYLLSKLEAGNERDSLSDSEDELPPPFELPPAFDSPDHECQSSAILLGSSLERSRLLEQQDAEFSESLFRDQQIEIEKEQEMKQFRDELNKQENLYKARCERVPQEPNFDDPHAKVSVRHVILGVKSRKFPLSCRVSSLYDWVGSLSCYPAYFQLSSCAVTKLEPTSPIETVDRALVSMAVCDEQTMFPVMDGNQLQHERPNSIATSDVTENIPVVLLEEDEL